MKKRRRYVTQRRPKSGAPHPTSFFAKDPAMRTLAAIAGILIGVMGTHVDLGRRIDALSVQVQGMAVRVESVEKCLDRHTASKK